MRCAGKNKVGCSSALRRFHGIGRVKGMGSKSKLLKSGSYARTIKSVVDKNVKMVPSGFG